ncbi:hypothetical protein FGIG_10728 [Fasciola gigantica]|uniref:USP domain-containing protein n=1 Tax=Fasciola gigantica TaxID=46835 RepID=A0A504YKA7_FASGI|nr:hypothetical protein FGIG_10728 [Fasciola gigantica]
MPYRTRATSCGRPLAPHTTSRMDVVIVALLRSQVTDEVKRSVLQNCLRVVENSEFSEELSGLTKGLLSVIDELVDPMCAVLGDLPEELFCIIQSVLRKTPNETFYKTVKILAVEQTDVLSYSSAVLVALLCDSDRFDSYLDLVIGDNEGLSDLFKSIMKALCSLGFSDSKFNLKAITGRAIQIAKLLRHCLSNGLKYDRLLSLACIMLQFMTQNFISPTQKINKNISYLIDLSFVVAELLIVLPSVKVSSDTESSGKMDIVSEFIYRKVETFIADPFTFDTAYLQLASLLFRLDSSFDVTPVTSFVDSLATLYSGDIEICFSILRRMTCWLVWPFRNEASPLDKWIIGFLCEVFRRTYFYPGAAEFVPPKKWITFMEEQLKLILQFLVQQNTTDMCILNLLAFLLLTGNSVARSHRFKTFSEELTRGLRSVSHRQSKNSDSKCEAFMSRISRILQLALSSLGVSNDLPTKCTLREVQNPTIQFFSQFEDTITPEKLMKRAKVYEWSTLLQWGSRAGDNLRRCWGRWEQYGDETRSCSPASMLYGHNNGCRLTNHGGLLNIGNTCYANATLQLLYHCPDFRLAVLENPRIQRISTKPPAVEHSALTRRTEILSPVDPIALGESRGGLHLQLFSLFRSLNTQMGPAVRDPGIVLSLSKPAHFVSGEQQDAVEYLIHLLQQLQDEEVELKRDSVNTPRDDDRFQEVDSTEKDSEKIHGDSCSRNTETIVDGSANAFSSPGIRDTTPTNQASDSPVSSAKLSVISRLFGGTLVRHTSCTECFHTSSILDEPFSCLYLPVSPADEAVVRSTNQHSKSEPNDCNRQPDNTDVDLTALLHTHFSQIERVSSVQACESCGKQTVLARRMCLKNLASHVLICLKVFTFCRESQTSSKVMKKITIPERLCVTLSGQVGSSTSGTHSSESFPNEFLFPSVKLSEDMTDPVHCDTEKPVYSATPSPSSSSCCLNDKAQPVTTRTFKLQGMILHHGLSLHCGHYTCVARVGMEWISFDDAFVHLTSLDQIYSTPLTTPYLLLYTQV